MNGWPDLIAIGFGSLRELTGGRWGREETLGGIRITAYYLWDCNCSSGVRQIFLLYVNSSSFAGHSSLERINRVRALEGEGGNAMALQLRIRGGN